MKMLQFNMTLYTATARLTPRLSGRWTALFATNSTPIASEVLCTNAKDNQIQSQEREENKNQKAKQEKQQGNFDELKKLIQKSVHAESTITTQIQSAQSLNDLLNLLKLPDISQKNTLAIMSSITNWVNNGNANPKDISGIVQRSDSSNSIPTSKQDEFAKYSLLSTNAMIQEIASLASQKNRHAPLLRYLSQNIVQYSETLSPGQCSKLLYSLCILNYIDENLLQKISDDAMQPGSVVKPKTLTSIVTSLGILRYKNENFLNNLCDLILDSKIQLNKPQLVAVLQTFAMLSFTSEKANSVIEKFMLPMEMTDFEKDGLVDFVWSLVVLNKARKTDIASVLDSKFITKFEGSRTCTLTRQLKLLNINAAAQFLLKNYDGPFVQSSSKISNAVYTRTKQKEHFITALSDALQNMMPSSSYYTINVTTQMGFIIDAIVVINNHGNFVPVTTENLKSTDITRIALIMNDYNDYCRGKKDPIGIINLYNRILQADGYRVLNISYEHFGVEDKIVKRVKYLKQCIKTIQEQTSV